MGASLLNYGVPSPFNASLTVLKLLSMNKTYVIQWKSRTNGRTGIGTTRFDRDEAEQLMHELNHDYPDIEHQLLDTQNEHATAPLISLPFPVGAQAE